MAEAQKSDTKIASAPGGGTGGAAPDAGTTLVVDNATGATIQAAPTMRPVEIRKAPDPIKERYFKEQAFRQNTWIATPEKGVRLEDVLKPEFWANVAKLLRAPDKIIVMAEDKSFYCELVVFDSYATRAEVRVFGEPIFDDPAKRHIAESDYGVVDGGLNKRWTIIQKSDGRELKADGTLHTREAAEIWLRDYLRLRGVRAA